MLANATDDSLVPLLIKWNGKFYPIELSFERSTLQELQELLCDYTGVCPQHQKLAGHPTLLKACPEQTLFGSLNLRPGQKLMLIGHATITPIKVISSLEMERIRNSAKTFQENAVIRAASKPGKQEDTNTGLACSSELAPVVPDCQQDNSDIKQFSSKVESRLEIALKSKVLCLDHLLLHCLTSEILAQIPPHLSLLNLSHNILRVFPSDLDPALLASLKTLVIDHNQLTELPETLLHLPAVEEYYCSANLLEQLPADSFHGCPHLRVLDLCANRLVLIDGLDPSLTNTLCVLRLSGNHLQKLPNVIYEMQRLQELSLERNQLKYFGLPLTQIEDGGKETFFGFCGLQQLRVLKLGGNQIPMFSESFFDWLPELCELDITGNLVSWSEIQKLSSYDRWVKRLDQFLKKKHIN